MSTTPAPTPKKRGRPKRVFDPNKPVDLKSELLPITEPRCHICNSPLRDRVDRLGAAGYGAKAIAEEIMGLDPVLSTKLETLRKNVDRHINNHLRIKQRAIRRILENRAKQQGILMENIETVFVDDKGLLDILIKQATEQVSEPDSRVYIKDALEAIKIKKEMESSEFSEQIRVMEKQLYAITQAIKDVVPTDYFQQITLRARQLFEGDVIELPRKEIEA